MADNNNNLGGPDTPDPAVGCSATAAPAGPQFGRTEWFPRPRHRPRPFPPRSVSLACLAVLALAVPVQGAESDGWLEAVKGFKPYAAVTFSDESNLLRVSDADASGPRSDQYWTTEAGFEKQLDISRQRLFVDGRIYRIDYDRFGQFDHTGGEGRLGWRWVLGKAWDGRLVYSYSRKLRDFDNQEDPVRDMIDKHRVYGMASRWLSPRWRASVEGFWVDVSSSERAILDKQVVSGTTAVKYVTASDNEIGMSANLSDASLDNASDRDYREWFFGPFANWQVTGKLRVSATAGYKGRDHDRSSDRDFDGAVGSVRAEWQATAKTALAVTASRDVSNFNDEIANYAVVDAIGIEPTWAITSKTTLRGMASYEERDFEGGDAAPMPGLPERVDDISTYGLWLDWAFSRNGVLSLGYTSRERESNRADEEYDTDLLQAQFRIGL